MKKTNPIRNIIVLAVIIALVVIASTAMAEAAVTQTGAKLSLTAPVSGSLVMGQTQAVKWSSTNYKLPTVSIRLLRKMSSNPARYEVVRSISDNAVNDGSAIWVPTNSDVGSSLMIEVGCKSSAVACQAGVATGSSLAVVRSTRYQNTASAFQAIEALNSKK